MNTKINENTNAESSEKKEWSAPVINLSEITATEGGAFTVTGKGDDTWYTS